MVHLKKKILYDYRLLLAVRFFVLLASVCICSRHPFFTQSHLFPKIWRHIVPPSLLVPL